MSSRERRLRGYEYRTTLFHRIKPSTTPTKSSIFSPKIFPIFHLNFAEIPYPFSRQFSPPNFPKFSNIPQIFNLRRTEFLENFAPKNKFQTISKYKIQLYNNKIQFQNISKYKNQLYNNKI